MGIRYDKLFAVAKSKGLNKTQLRLSAGISTVTLAKLSKNESITIEVLERLCEVLKCQPGDILSYESANVQIPVIDENLTDEADIPIKTDSNEPVPNLNTEIAPIETEPAASMESKTDEKEADSEAITQNDNEIQPTTDSENEIIQNNPDNNETSDTSSAETAASISVDMSDSQENTETKESVIAQKAKEVLASYLQKQMPAQMLQDTNSVYKALSINFAYNTLTLDGEFYDEEDAASAFERYSNQEDDDTLLFRTFKALDFAFENISEKLTKDFLTKLAAMVSQQNSSIFVSGQMQFVLENYNETENIEIEDLIQLHYDIIKSDIAEKHTGTLARIILLKECLKKVLPPILLEGDFKMMYNIALNKFENDRGYLYRICKNGQETFKETIEKQ